MWLSLIWFLLFWFVCWNLFCTIANLRIKCVTETKLFCFTKILNQAFYMTHTFDFEVSLHYWLLWPTVYHTVYTLCNEITANLGEGCDIGLGKWTIFFVFLREKFSFCPKKPCDLFWSSSIQTIFMYLQQN